MKNRPVIEILKMLVNEDRITLLEVIELLSSISDEKLEGIIFNIERTTNSVLESLKEHNLIRE